MKASEIQANGIYQWRMTAADDWDFIEYDDGEFMWPGDPDHATVDSFADCPDHEFRGPLEVPED